LDWVVYLGSHNRNSLNVMDFLTPFGNFFCQYYRKFSHRIIDGIQLAYLKFWIMNTKPCFIAGFLGGFTTFSSFGFWKTLVMLQNGKFLIVRCILSHYIDYRDCVAVRIGVLYWPKFIFTKKYLPCTNVRSGISFFESGCTGFEPASSSWPEYFIPFFLSSSQR